MAIVRDNDPNEWVVEALCAGDPPDALFVRGAAQRKAKQRCVDCPVRLECLADALQWRCDFGVWGGLTERERRTLRRKFSSVDNWLDWLTNSDDDVAVQIRRAGKAGRIQEQSTLRPVIV